MKTLLIGMMVALLIVGCGGDGKSGPDSPESNQSSVEMIDLDDKETRDRIIAGANDWKKLKYRGEEGEKLAYAPNQQTPYTGWVKLMYDNGQINGLGQLKDGKPDGFSTKWHQDGQKKRESTHKDGKLWTAVKWKPNGEKCPVTNVVDGNGVVVLLSEDGTEIGRDTYKNGERVTD